LSSCGCQTTPCRRYRRGDTSHPQAAGSGRCPPTGAVRCLPNRRRNPSAFGQGSCFPVNVQSDRQPACTVVVKNAGEAVDNGPLTVTVPRPFAEQQLHGVPAHLEHSPDPSA
jgi:hypothetical protein